MAVVASRYARALIEAMSPDQADAGLDQIQRLNDLMATEEDVRKLLLNPVVPQDRRKRFIERLAEAMGLDPRVRRLFVLIVDRRRLPILADVVVAYQQMLDQRNGIVRAQVRAAAPLSEAEQREIAARLEKTTGKRVVMEIDEDPELIAGLVVRIGSTVYDGSLRQNLAGFRQRMVKG